MKSIYEEIQALNQSDLLPRAKSLYLALMELAEGTTMCKAILASLVFKSGMSESSVIRATKELESAGFISVARFDKRGPSTPPNIYTLIHRTVQSCQIDSTSTVKSTGKNTNNKEETTNTLTTNIACQPDTRGFAPSVRDDRPEDINKDIRSVLEQYQLYLSEEEILFGREIVSLIGINALESKLQDIIDHYNSLETFKPPIQESLKNIFEESHKSSDTSLPNI